MPRRPGLHPDKHRLGVGGAVRSIVRGIMPGMTTPREVVDGALKIANAITPFLPESIKGPVEIVNLLVRDVERNTHLFTEDELAAMVAREQAAGASANQASHLAGLREAIERDLWDSETKSAGLKDTADRVYQTVLRYFAK